MPIPRRQPKKSTVSKLVSPPQSAPYFSAAPKEKKGLKLNPAKKPKGPFPSKKQWPKLQSLNGNKHCDFFLFLLGGGRTAPHNYLPSANSIRTAAIRFARWDVWSFSGFKVCLTVVASTATFFRVNLKVAVGASSIRPDHGAGNGHSREQDKTTRAAHLPPFIICSGMDRSELRRVQLISQCGGYPLIPTLCKSLGNPALRDDDGQNQMARSVQKKLVSPIHHEVEVNSGILFDVDCQSKVEELESFLRPSKGGDFRHVHVWRGRSAACSRDFW